MGHLRVPLRPRTASIAGLRVGWGLAGELGRWGYSNPVRLAAREGLSLGGRTGGPGVLGCCGEDEE